ncbi:hypothetical protein BT67DRAFT_444700 [Trichocladium antarcticum]|uniref:Uncharacterized protein n=1 Tax=Trichocladium antarcticum TaxID=1450529 RepID=A0AAN6UEZ4_9PEZI|nr:hypothetical protein BT67DRAFT_444700 [Trichocladium antarcticum]
MVRFQRAFMTYFSMENGRFAGNSKALAISHLFTGDKPLIYGLFSGVGQPLAALSDGIELRTAILVVESLTLSAVDWMEPMYELMTHPELARPSRGFLSPGDIIGRVAHDGRFSGVMKGGPGFQGVPNVFASPNAKAALVEYVGLLDCRNLTVLLQQLSALSVVMSCATHKPGQPAFDYYLGHLPTCINSTRIILDNLVEDGDHRILVVRGVWLLMLLTYITQLRPVMDEKLLVAKDLADEENGWETMYEVFRGEVVVEGKLRDLEFLRALRSLWELSRVCRGVHGNLYFHAAWKLVSEWTAWAGRGVGREAMLNIRL